MRFRHASNAPLRLSWASIKTKQLTCGLLHACSSNCLLETFCLNPKVRTYMIKMTTTWRKCLRCSRSSLRTICSAENAPPTLLTLRETYYACRRASNGRSTMYYQRSNASSLRKQWHSQISSFLCCTTTPPSASLHWRLSSTPGSTWRQTRTMLWTTRSKLSSRSHA